MELRILFTKEYIFRKIILFSCTYFISCNTNDNYKNEVNPNKNEESTSSRINPKISDSTIYYLDQKKSQNNTPSKYQEPTIKVKEITSKDINVANILAEEINLIYPSLPYIVNNFIDVGRSQTEVLKIQGLPELKTDEVKDNIAYEIWWYENSTIKFYKGNVDAWDNESENLKLIDESQINWDILKNATIKCYYSNYQKRQNEISMAQIFSKIR